MNYRLPTLLQYVFIFCIAVSLGFFLISRAKRLFRFIRPEIVRRNVVTYLIGLCFFFALGYLIPDFSNIITDFGWGYGFLLCAALVLFNVTIPYNIVLQLTKTRRFATMGPVMQQVLLFCSIVLPAIVINGLINYFINGTTQLLKYSVAWSFYIAGFGALVYLYMRHYEMERQRKWFEKELELAKLNEQKIGAELEALHSKINPHFLYNALNSIAELSITDGPKARTMTLSLADLFRYSLNYNKSNYATVREELELAKLYLQIEKIRFEDALIYAIDAPQETLSCLVPKYLLQPILENAVKHGLKTTGTLTQIYVTVYLEAGRLWISVHDNGPPFPEQPNPGYGLKSIYDKLDLLFPGAFDLQLINEPVKQFQICLHHVLKTEPLAQSNYN